MAGTRGAVAPAAVAAGWTVAAAAGTRTAVLLAGVTTAALLIAAEPGTILGVTVNVGCMNRAWTIGAE